MAYPFNFKSNVYLIGFMGTGKSTVARHLAERLNFKRIDVDAAIEARVRKTVAEIFDQCGEAAFRAMERAFIENGHPDSQVVVACGGGLPVQPGMFELLAARGVVVALLARPETVYSRTRRNRQRPLLNVKQPLEAIRSLLAERDKVYRQAPICVETDSISSEAVADIICEQLAENF